MLTSNLKKLSRMDSDFLEKPVKDWNLNKENVDPNIKKIVGVSHSSHSTCPKILINEPFKNAKISTTGHSKVLKQENSFDEILKVLTAPDDKENEPEETMPPQENLTQSTPRNVSATRNITTSTNLPSSKQTINDLSFEEMLTIMLTPDLVPPERQSGYFLKNEQMKNPDHDKKIDDMTFEEIMEKMLVTDSQRERDDINSDNISDEPNVDSALHSEVLDSNSCIEEPNFSKKDLSEQKLKEKTDASNLENEMEYEDMMSQLITPCSENEENQQSQSSTQKSSREIFTQTSFDLTPSPLECSCIFNDKNVEMDSGNLGTSTRKKQKTKRGTSRVSDSANPETSTTKEQKTKKGTSEVSKNPRVLRNTKKQLCDQPVEQEQHVNILDVLTDDISILPEGFKFFNNISQIGTSAWLQHALTAVENLTVPHNFNPKDPQNVKVLEVENTRDMYRHDVLKKQLQIFEKAETTIYRIHKSGTADFVSGCDLEVNSYLDPEDGTEAERILRTAIDAICKDQELISNNFDTRVIDKYKIITKIHEIFSKIYEVFAARKNPCLVIRSSRAKGSVLKYGRFRYKPLKESPLQTMPFKAKHKRRSNKFCRLLYVLGKIYSLLENNTKLTKREIFYQCKHLVTSQNTIDTCIGDITRLLGLGYWHLNIISQKGLVYGNIKLVWASGETTNCNIPGTSIPSDVEDLVEVQSTACFILIVEKESIYHKLLEEDILNKLARPFVMITGKGLPSFNTRLFVNTLANMMAIPVFILADADIYGIRIMMTYRFGSISSCHLSDQLALPNSRWLGVFPSDITKYGMQQQGLTKLDRITISSLLKYPMMDNYPRMKEEIKVLSDLNMKASIEGLIKNNTFLSQTYLPMKFVNREFI